MTRREWISLGGTLATAACARRKRAGFSGWALIATSGEQSVAAVDLTTFRLTKQIQVDANPTAVLTGGPANSSFVLTPATGSVHRLDARLNRTASQRLAHDLSAFALMPDGKRLLALSPQSRELLEVDSTTLQVLSRRKLVATPAGLDISNDGYAAITSVQQGVLDLIHPLTGLHKQKTFGGPIGEARFRSDGKLLLVANLADRSVTAVDVPGLQTVVDLPLAMHPRNLCFKQPDQGQLFVSGEGMDGIAIIFPYETLQVEQTVLAGRDPGIMASSGDPAYLFVGSASGSDVCILNVDTRKLIGLVEVGQQPSSITITPDNQFALILDKQSGDMAVIHISAIRSARAPSGSSGYTLPRLPASLFTLIPVGDKPVHLAVVARSA